MSQKMQAKPGTKITLSQYDPSFCEGYSKKDPEVKAKLQEDLDEMRALQEKLYAEGQRALLVVLQAMDAGGKDGTIRHVMGGLNPQGCEVSCFKVPTHEELAHDFLWRIHRRTPARGHIGVFNRSHYEDVLVVRVHNLVPEKLWQARYEQINAFEKLLSDSGTRVLKFFLHISKEEQKERLQARITNPDKHWKLSDADAKERLLWDDYRRAYEDALSRCNTEWAPWYIIPADRKWYRNMVVADIIAGALRQMDPQWPEPKVDVSKLVIE